MADPAAEKLAWLAQHTEDVLEPDLVICDPHHHLWDHPRGRYEVDELHADTGAGHNVVSTVFVECGSEYLTDGPEAFRPVGETAYVARLAAESERRAGATIAGIVGHADLRDPDVAEVLAAHLEAGGGRFRGIRHVSADDPSPAIHTSHSNPPAGLLGQADFRRGFDALGAAGLRFDAYLYHPQLTELLDLVRSHPDVPVVLDHLGGPLGIGPYEGRRDEVLAAWRPVMAELAAHEQVSLKLGGIGMPIYGNGWHRQERPPTSDDLVAGWVEPIRFCIDAFGVDRCMFESNFPVDRQSCSYVVLWNAFKKIVADASESDKRALFHDTATRRYGLA